MRIATLQGRVFQPVYVVRTEWERFWVATPPGPLSNGATLGVSGTAVARDIIASGAGVVGRSGHVQR